MNFPLFVSKRYFFSKKKTNFINIITGMSLGGLCIGTAALVIALSVFNGMEDLFKNLYSSFSSELQVKPVKGKTFEADEDFLIKLKKIEGVDNVYGILEDNALLVYRDAQMVVKVRGVNEKLLIQNGLKKKILQGKLKLRQGGINYAIVGAGVQYTLSMPLNDSFNPLQIIYPRNKKRINLNSTDALNQESIQPSGVFQIEQKYDMNYIFVPLEFARDLFGTSENKRSFIEIKTKPGYKIESIQNNLKKILGPSFTVLNRDEQNADILRAIKIEKFFVFITLSFIVAIASFNIFFSLTMLAIDKRKDIAVLYSLGANENIIRKIFLFEGAIIAFVGAGLGLLLGIGICLFQKYTGLITMGMQTAVENSYPVSIHYMDLFFTALVIIFITIGASYFPAAKSSMVIGLSAAMKE